MGFHGHHQQDFVFPPRSSGPRYTWRGLQPLSGSALWQESAMGQGAIWQLGDGRRWQHGWTIPPFRSMIFPALNTSISGKCPVPLFIESISMNSPWIIHEYSMSIRISLKIPWIIPLFYIVLLSVVLCLFKDGWFPAGINWSYDPWHKNQGWRLQTL